MPNFPYLECEVKYAVREMAVTVVDVLARRTRLAFLDNEAARAAVPTVVKIMAHELGWSKERQQRETKEAHAFLDTMCIAARKAA